MRKIRYGDRFRVPYRQNDPADLNGIPSIRALTQGRHDVGMDTQKGIFYFRHVSGVDGFRRMPAIILTSDSNLLPTPEKPWVDRVEPHLGYAIYHGDNHEPGRSPEESRGNRAIINALPMYFAPAKRYLAPPILLFQKIADGQRQAMRRFVGFGVPTGVRMQTQFFAGTEFINFVFDVALFNLDHEKGLFDWSWIDDRREPSLTANACNRIAPKSWKEWVEDGDRAIERVRRRVYGPALVPPKRQREMPVELLDILKGIYGYHSDDRHEFEGLASFVAHRVCGREGFRGWVTKRSGDGGVDFVNRLDVGSGTARAVAVVLGQAKCLDPLRGTVGGRDLARVVARLRRGWIGAFVTTGVYSLPAQAEVAGDDYPIVLINGRQLAEVVHREMTDMAIDLSRLLDRELEWYRANLRHLEPLHIARPDALGTPFPTGGHGA